MAAFCVIPLLAQQARDESAQAIESHKHLAGYNRGSDNLREKLTRSPARSVKVYRYAPAEGRLDSAPSPTPRQLFINHVCQADAIVMGSVQSIKSLLSADESQVFTDYKMIPLTIIKGENLAPGGPFYVTEPGGAVHIDGGEIVDVGAEYPSPLFSQKTYLLFLTTVDSTKTFRLVDNLSTYLLDGTHVRIVTESTERDSINIFLWSLSPDVLVGDLQKDLQSCPNRGR